MKLARKKVIRVVSAAIADGDKYLITQRNASAVLPLLWEFPGGRVEDGETDEAALRRELFYRLGIRAEIAELLNTTQREYETYVVHLQVYRCGQGPTPPQALRVRDLQWVRSDEFDFYTFTPADQAAMDAMLFGRPLAH
jgi:8-oxo-dGTP diphosphatase